ncbi:Hypothetical predicted protein [Xyrichtys novacula]|uniref:Uncharacterized protein n=1 Tax=Xyrichtys novacula TaxID=13765 RepID=A0AAV1F8B0_XYRNO|nr:Hypothetical predicted protein [Xyrichtys novacula]
MKLPTIHCVVGVTGGQRRSRGQDLKRNEATSVSTSATDTKNDGDHGEEAQEEAVHLGSRCTLNTLTWMFRIVYGGRRNAKMNKNALH